MDQRRFVTFLTISIVFWIIWIQFIAEPLGLLPKPAARKNNDQKTGQLSESQEPADALVPENVAETAEKASEISPIERHPVQSVWLGAPREAKDEIDSFFLAAKLDSRGGAIASIELTDIKRYPAIGDRSQRVELVGGASTRTMEMRVPAIDDLLKGESLDSVPWELVDGGAKDPSTATFRLVSPDGKWELVKKYDLRRLTPAEMKTPGIRDNFAAGYELTLSLTIRNRAAKAQEISYSLRGPVGLPLEDKDNTYKYRDVRMGLLSADGSTVEESKVAATEVVKKVKENKPEITKRPLKYVGVDVLYFAALMMPQGNQNTERTVDRVDAVVVAEDKASPQYSDISYDLVSPSISVPANGELTHKYVLYAGPKRKELVQQLSAGAVMDYGWFDSICRGMVYLLNAFHSLGLSYGVAILCLTVLVRTLLIPLSKHQAAHAAKMKELQPKIAARQKELEAKHGKNTEEYIKASQELVAEQSKMMLGGCLPVFLQLPIFIALYRAIGSSIELRMEPFLWFENLASPDALFPLPFRVPFLGWTEFNLLPCVSAALMYLQQKLTMPPPANQEQADQQKVMNFMMIIMIGAFYRVPSGLCLYFIATNIWSMVERWYMERKAKLAKLNPPEATISADATTKKGPEQAVESTKTTAKLAGWWQQMVESADTSRTIRNEPKDSSDRSDKKKKKR